MLKTRNNMTFARILWLSLLTLLSLGTLILIGCTATSPHNMQDPMPTEEVCSFLPPADPDYIPTYDPPLSSDFLIDSSWHKGEINNGERMVYMAYALAEAHSLPEKYIGNLGVDGTMYLIELHELVQDPEIMCALKLCEQEELRRILQTGSDCRIF